ncbi:MAG: hypothetical protein R3B47_19425 [Bacteroidia bacterium]
MVAFSLWYRFRPQGQPGGSLSIEQPPPIAILYTTCNDFVEASARSCMEQDYPNFRVYLLDDSASPEYQARVLMPSRYKVSGSGGGGATPGSQSLQGWQYESRTGTGGYRRTLILPSPMPTKFFHLTSSASWFP